MLASRCRIAVAWLTIVLGCVIATQAASAGAPPERDIWYSIRDGDQPYGSMHVVVRRLDDGAAEYVVQSLLKVEFFGSRQEFKSSATAIVNPDLSLRRMDSESEQSSGRTRIRGRVTDEGWAVEHEQEGKTYESTFVLDDEIAAVSSLALGDWLHRLVSEADQGVAETALTRRLRIIAAESGEPQEATVRLISHDARGSAWSIDFEQEWRQTTLRLDADGVMTEQTVMTPPMRITRASPHEAAQVDYRVIPDRELLIFPFDRELPPTRRLERIDVRLTWRDIDPEEFNIEDSRQRLVSIEEREGGHVALVRLQRPAEGGPDATLPLPREQFESTLASSDFILPEDERIAATVAEIVGEETSARAAATAICQWVSDYIQPAMIAETLSGPQVLERRTGKCSEYSTLFASLARAAGIPTRLALGERRFAGADGDTWGGHMWNEVYVGQWIPIDASVNEVGGSLDLLKFIHSDTVLGTQPLRWKLTRSLTVSIADVELIPEAPGEAIEPGLRGTTYSSAEHRFRFSIPDETWTVEETKAAGAQVLRLRPADADLGDSAMIHVTAFSLPKGVSPKVVLDARLRHQRSSLNEVEVFVDEAVEINGVAGHRLRFGGTPKAERGVPMRVTEVLLIHGESAVLINLISTIEHHEKFGEAIKGIASSLTFIE